MSAGADREVRERLRGLRAEGEAEAAERSWETIRAAYADRERAPRRRRWKGLAATAAALGLAAAIGLTPAGADLRSWVSDAIDPESTNPRPALTKLPGGGSLLIDTGRGTAIVAGDGSRRFLGTFAQASLSPHGMYVAGAEGRTLTAVDPRGEPRWSLSRPEPVSQPRWSREDGYAVAYLAGSRLRVVAGDGSEDRGFATARRVAPAWRGETDEVLGYVDEAGAVVVADVERNEALARISTPGEPELLAFSAGGERVLVASGRSVSVGDWGGKDVSHLRLGSRVVDAGFLGDGEQVAVVTRRTGASGTASAVSIVRTRGDDGELAERRVFQTPGRLAGLAVSPGGDWLAVGWKDADQWLFIEPAPGGAVRAVDGVTAQLAPGERNPAFPVPVEWCCPP